MPNHQQNECDDCGSNGVGTEGHSESRGKALHKGQVTLHFVARRGAEGEAFCAAFMDECEDPLGAATPDILLYFRQKGSSGASAAVLRGHRHMVDEGPPTVEGGDGAAEL